MPTILLILCGAVSAGAAEAESWSTADLRPCVALEDDVQRLACFDRLAAEKLAEAADADPARRSYSTVIPGRNQPAGASGRTHQHDIRIVAFVREHRRGRDWRRYVSDDGRYWRLPDDEPESGRELPFEADVVPDPAEQGVFVLRPSDGGEPIHVIPDTPEAQMTQ